MVLTEVPDSDIGFVFGMKIIEMKTYELLTVITATGSVLIAASGLAISIVSLRRSNAVRAQQLRLQEKQEELVDIQLQLHKMKADSLEIGNQKTKTADVRVSLEGTVRQARASTGSGLDSYRQKKPERRWGRTSIGAGAIDFRTRRDPGSIAPDPLTLCARKLLACTTAKTYSCGHVHRR